MVSDTRHCILYDMGVFFVCLFNAPAVCAVVSACLCRKLV